MLRRGPDHPMTTMGRQMQPVARLQSTGVVLIGQLQFSASGQQEHPLIMILVIPRPFRRNLPSGNDSFNLNTARLLQQRLNNFSLPRIGQMSQQIATPSDATHGHLD